MSLYASQIKAFKSAEPKTLGAIQIIIGVLTVIMSTIVYKLHYHIQREIIILIVNGAQLVITGIVLVHTGRKPSKCMVLTSIVLQLLTAAFDIVGFGLMARHIPFRGESYYYRDTEFLVNGILGTLIAFLVLACIIGLVVSLFGVYALSVSAIKELTPIPHATEKQHYGAGLQAQNSIHAGN
ncbi:membrane-spanning 4-domains subfamily A member 15 isoform X2 [Triplophysa dalaica]|uniref:membrane-spanning 4-domains subfamily A member 15 isoform X2 n=1 Tax=Triplophysa dalaica TaxID=1582913 RepID=UPI0024DF7315|nr:membrane-spanning 4-domains subfamily A member 15 isoform X2 [Triplophysa dalaica]